MPRAAQLNTLGGGEAFYVKCDVSDEDQVAAFIEARLLPCRREKGQRALVCRWEARLPPFNREFKSLRSPEARGRLAPNRLLAFAQAAVTKFGRIDCLINNAGW